MKSNTPPSCRVDLTCYSARTLENGQQHYSPLAGNPDGVLSGKEGQASVDRAKTAQWFRDVALIDLR